MTDRSVVLITVDCLRSDHVGCYGYDRPTTPNVDAFAEDATLFERSFSNGPGTRWALQTIHAGVWPDQIDGLGIPEQRGVALAEHFKEAGYATGGFGKNGFLTRDYNYHKAFDTYYGVREFKDHPLKRTGVAIDDKLKSDFLREKVLSPMHDLLKKAQSSEDGQYRPHTTDEEVCGHALDWIRRKKASDEPYFAWVHLMDAHTPYGRYDKHLEALRGDTDVEHVIDPHGVVNRGDPEIQPKVRDAYDAGIRSADEQIGRLLAAVSDDATVAITGDHGEEFGRYKGFHQASLYSSMTRVPLVVRGPDFDAERVDAYPVQHLDIPPTLLAAAGGSPPNHWVGDALQDPDRGSDAPIHFSLTDPDPEQGVRVGEWKYIRYEDTGREELYRGSYDEPDDENLADERPEKLAELRELAADHAEWMAKKRVGEATAGLEEGKDDLSNAVRNNLEELGYIE
ncbi:MULTISPECIES: sulfatase [Halorussus]|uniref:sulfatase n=1 Tax=Halorussus TaxID=1070314 RepID=UPI00209E0CD1|nr:sulfatase [Halorussus vallis]USZ78411.1 sulfatase-like hydrolase/transferase [Halorussus vallis]